MVSRVIVAAVMLLSFPFLAQAKIKVVASIFPCYELAREIGGERTEVSILLPPGVEAHAFDPSPGKIFSLNKSDVFIYMNKYMEPWVADMLKSMPRVGIIVVDLGEGIHFIKANDDEKGREPHGADPHTWLDMRNTALMADNIAKVFAKRDPIGAKDYFKNASIYKKKLEALDRAYVETIKKCRLKRLYFAGHYAFGYFSERYGLEYTSPYKGYSPDAEPSPKSIIELIKAIKKNGVKYLYHEELISPKIAEVISNETGCELLRLSAAHNVTKVEIESGKTFIDIMKENLVNLKKGLEWQAK
ncbi:MAG: zinc ABC transporter substrate-binding protein [Candidatus Firestonebacteria bacterium]